MTGQRQVVEIVTATKGARDDVINGKAMVEKNFGRMTILALMMSSFRNNDIKFWCHESALIELYDLLHDRFFFAFSHGEAN